jgi:hypothetical protein
VATDLENHMLAFDPLPAGTVGEVRYQVQAARALVDGSCCLGSDIGPTAMTSVVIDSPVEDRTTTPRRSRTSGRRSSPATRPAAPVVDEGFEETLDFEDFEPGLEDAIPPADSRNLLQVDDDEGPSEGVLVPAATASVLAVWAMHLRYLSRRAGDAP